MVMQYSLLHCFIIYMQIHATEHAWGHGVLCWCCNGECKSQNPVGCLQSGLYEAKPCEGHKGSVYALALDEPGNLMAAGSTEGAIRISDTRSQTILASLKGHTENIRSVSLQAWLQVHPLPHASAAAWIQ